MDPKGRTMSDFDWKETLRAVAPGIATALGGPLAGAAVKILGDKVLGRPDATQDEVVAALSSGSLTGEQIVALKSAEQTFQLEMAKIDASQDAAIIDDKKSAREMESSTHSPVPAILSYFVTVGYFGVLTGMMTKWLVVSDSQVALMMLGSLTTAWGSVLAFWFGSTRDSARKTDLLAQAPAVAKAR